MTAPAKTSLPLLPPRNKRGAMRREKDVKMPSNPSSNKRYATAFRNGACFFANAMTDDDRPGDCALCQLRRCESPKAEEKRRRHGWWGDELGWRSRKF